MTYLLLCNLKSSSLLWFFADQVGITSPRQVVKICDKAVLELKEYCEQGKSSSGATSSTNAGENRFTNLLLRLSPLRSLQPDVLEELFFAGLIGNVQIDSVVPYILKMESSEYQAATPNGGKDHKNITFEKVQLSFRNGSQKACFWCPYLKNDFLKRHVYLILFYITFMHKKCTEWLTFHVWWV